MTFPNTDSDWSVVTFVKTDWKIVTFVKTKCIMCMVTHWSFFVVLFIFDMINMSVLISLSLSISLASVSSLYKQLCVSGSITSSGRYGGSGTGVQGVRLGLHKHDRRNPVNPAYGHAAHSVHFSV